MLQVRCAVLRCAVGCPLAADCCPFSMTSAFAYHHWLSGVRRPLSSPSFCSSLSSVPLRDTEHPRSEMDGCAQRLH